MLLKENILFHNRYLLQKRLRQGGFSEVWLAGDTKTGLNIALKVFAPGTGLDDDGVKLFSGEFALVFNLNHTNLLRPSHYDVFEYMPYLVLPYCKRGSVAGMAGKISETEIWKFLHDVAAGLAYLHAQEPPVIHQDIKPDNILMDANGYLITDFGISTKIRSTLRRSTIQSGGGTLAYMGPERFGKDNMPVKASDIWALGASVYELMTGNPPFGEHGGLIQKSGADIPDAAEEWPDGLKEMVNDCLQKETWDRPTAEEIVTVTEQHFRGEPVQPGKNRKQETTTPSHNRMAAPTKIKEEQQKNNPLLWILGALAVVVVIILLITGLPRESNIPTVVIAEDTTPESNSEQHWASNEPGASSPTNPAPTKSSSEVPQKQARSSTEPRKPTTPPAHREPATVQPSVIEPAEDPRETGDKYYYGRGVLRDCHEAARWYRKSAEQGDAYAQNRLGEMYGIYNPFVCYVATDYAEALKWFRLSAAQGNADAQCNLGSMYQQGAGVALDMDEAMRWYRLSAAQGNQTAKTVLDAWELSQAMLQMLGY